MRKLSVDWLREEMERAPVDYAMHAGREHSGIGRTGDFLSESQAASLRAKMAVRYGEWTNRDLRLDLAEDAALADQGKGDTPRPAPNSGGDR
ncbi:hypothetical protein [Methylorubrum extorquens]|uniref:Uncharacterized protein n=1 Tax=Methylorubrum extorquens (strain CM4 / NCIMB 13688) TaxID=440085 RepID=B7KTI1_METC4|nr:hypothetical protein [Methylorubrum extorquens]ACK82508.1 hypothetical protein Mchl_1644 [Methylorubrum extorquens CM4]